MSCRYGSLGRSSERCRTVWSASDLSSMEEDTHYGWGCIQVTLIAHSLLSCDSCTTLLFPSSFQAASQYYVRSRYSLLLLTKYRGLSVCLSVGLSQSWALQKWLNQSRPFGIWTWVGPRNHLWDGDSDPPCEDAIFGGKEMPMHVWRHCHELCKNGWTNRDAVWIVDSDGPKEACIRCDAHWCHLANTIEPSMWGDDAACCEITLTTWLHWYWELARVDCFCF